MKSDVDVFTQQNFSDDAFCRSIRWVIVLVTSNDLALRARPFWNYSPDYTLNWLHPQITRSNNYYYGKPSEWPNWWRTYSLNLLYKVPMKLKTVNCCHKVSPLLQLHCEVLEWALEARIMWAAAVANMNDLRTSSGSGVRSTLWGKHEGAGDFKI